MIDDEGSVTRDTRKLRERSIRANRVCVIFSVLRRFAGGRADKNMHIIDIKDKKRGRSSPSLSLSVRGKKSVEKD